MSPRDRHLSAPGQCAPLPDAIARQILLPRDAPAPAAPARRVGRRPHGPDTGSQKLTPREIGHLVALARDAWHATSAGEPFDDWRHAQCLAAVGCRLSQATRADFRDLKAHFLTLLGHTSAARQLRRRSGPNPAAPTEFIEDREQALYLLQAALKAGGFHPNYALTIARSKFHRDSLAACTAHELACLRNDILNRTRSRRRRGS